MYRLSRQFDALLLCTALAVATSAGCGQEPVPVAVPVSAHDSPEESFEGIVAVLKEGLELPGGQASGFVSSNSSASSRFQVHNTVSSNFIPPAKEGEPYRGEITVTTQSIYSLRKSAEQKEDDDDEDSKRRTSLLDESHDSGPGFSSVDQGLVSEAPDSSKPGTSDIDSVQRRADKIERKFELIYKNNRWDLVTKIDKETEASIENAFQRALRLQP